MSEQELERARGTPSTRSPRLNLTGRIRSILDGDEDPLEQQHQDSVIPSPIHHEVSMDTTEVQDVEGTSSGGGGETTQATPPQRPRQDPEDTQVELEAQPNHGGGEVADIKDLFAHFFNMSPEEQGTYLLNYQTNMDQLLKQNEEMAKMVNTVNQQQNLMSKQVDETLAQNQQLLETLKSKPDVEEITKEVTSKLGEEYQAKLTVLVEINKKELLEQQEKHQKELQEREKTV